MKVDDFVGTVEAIGLRSTRIRTLDRTLVSLPNGKLSPTCGSSRSPRATAFGSPATSASSTGPRRGRCGRSSPGLEGASCEQHPKIWPDAVVVRFKQFGASSLDIEVMAWFQTSEWSEFQLIRQEVLLQFMAVVEGAGTSFAFPTRTVHLATPAVS